jgi:hypothetical protein
VEQLGGPQNEVKLAASSCGLRKQEEGRAEPVGFGRRPWKAPEILERVLKNSPAHGAWNVKQAVVETGEASSALVLRGCGVRLPITGEPGKWQAAERESEGS